MSSKKNRNATKAVQELLNTTAPKGEHTGARPEKLLNSDLIDMRYGHVDVDSTPKYCKNTVESARYSDDDIAWYSEHLEKHPVDKMLLEHDYGGCAITETRADIDSYYAEREEKARKVAHDEGYAEGYDDGHAAGIRDALIVGGVLLGVGYGIYRLHKHFTSDEYKAKREAKQLARDIKRLEKHGYVIVPPEESDERDELLEIDEDLRRLELEVLGY